MNLQSIKPIYRIVVQSLFEGNSRDGYKILSEASIAYHPSGRTHSSSHVFVRGIRHIVNSFGLLDLIPSSDLEHHRETLDKIVKENPRNRITYTIYNNGFAGVKIEDLEKIDKIAYVSNDNIYVLEDQSN